MTIYVLDVALAGFDISWRLGSVMTTGQEIDVISSIAVLQNTTQNTIRIAKTATGFAFSLYGSETLVDKFLYNDVDEGNHLAGLSFQVVFYHEFASVSVDGRWIHTFYPPFISYAEDAPSIWIKPNFNITLLDLRKKELSDWREAIYVDLETTSQNALGSLIQQRPVEIIPKWNGEIAFQYWPQSRAEVDLSEWAAVHVAQDNENAQICSEAIVYHTNVGLSVDEPTFLKYGFITRVYRMPDLDSGAMKAASVQQKRSRQAARMHTIQARMNPSIEIGDAVVNTPNLPGTNTQLDYNVIVEGVSISFKTGEYLMNVRGRNNE